MTGLAAITVAAIVGAVAVIRANTNAHPDRVVPPFGRLLVEAGAVAVAIGAAFAFAGSVLFGAHP